LIFFVLKRFSPRYAPHALDDETCINVTARLELGVYLLLAGALLVFVVTRIVLWRTYPFRRFADEVSIYSGDIDRLIN